MIDYTTLLDEISETGNLTKSCKTHGVNKSNFLLHCSQDADLADRYARAREAGLDAEADRAIQEALEAKDAGLGRLALDARKWYLSKLLPHKYGDKVAVAHSGSIRRTDDLGDDELAAIATSGSGRADP